MSGTIAKLIFHIVHTVQPEKIILFGSVVNGKPNVFSDVDLLVITDQICRQDDLKKEISSFAQEFSLKADVLIHAPAEVEKALLDQTSFLGAVVKAGKTVYDRQGRNSLTLV